MFSEELKESTMGVHQGLEKKLIGQIKRVATVDNYVQLLGMMYGFYVPLQQKVEPYLLHNKKAGQNAGGSSGREAGAILNDITYLTGRSPGKMPVTEHLPAISSYPSALGSMYVTEGSTLGGVIIAGMISKKLGIPANKGFSFFNGYGNQTQAMWQDFKSILNGPFTASEKLEIKETAIATFSTFNEWIQLYESAIN